MTRRVVEKLCTKKVCVDFGPYSLGVVFPTFRLSINSCVSDRVKLIETD